MSSRSFRQKVFRIHTWIGLHVCLLLGLLFATGAFLQVANEVTLAPRGELWVNPLKTETTASFGDIYDSVGATKPGTVVSIISRAPQPWFGDRAYSWNRDEGQIVVWTHPESAEVLGVTGSGAFRKIIRSMHDTLLVPGNVSHAVVSGLSIVLLISLITGIITYRRFWKGLFRFPRKNADRRSRMGTWHRVLAVWLLPFLLVMAVTSFVFFLNSVGFKAKSAEPAPVAAREWRLPEGFDGAAMNALVAMAEEAHPGLVATNVSLPGRKSEPYSISGYEKDTGQTFGGVRVVIDPLDMKILGVITRSDANFIGRLMPLVNTIHYGTWGGPASLVLWLIFGIGGTTLLFTGARIYIARTRAGAAAEADGRGGLALFVAGLGVFKWAYLLLLLMLIALILKRTVL